MCRSRRWDGEMLSTSLDFLLSLNGEQGLFQKKQGIFLYVKVRFSKKRNKGEWKRGSWNWNRSGTCYSLWCNSHKYRSTVDQHRLTQDCGFMWICQKYVYYTPRTLVIHMPPLLAKYISGRWFDLIGKVHVHITAHKERDNRGTRG